MNSFKQIFEAIRKHELWGFPLAVVRSDNDHWDKKPLVKWKHLQEHPPTAAELNDWYQRFPNAGAGIPTGPGTGILVVDADTIEAIERLELGGVRETWLTRTRRGFHYFYRWPRVDCVIHNSASEIAPGVDVRAAGGQVVGAGTVCPDGFVYRWADGHSPADLPLADLPHWLLAALVARERAKHPVTPPCRPRPYGGRTSAWARRAFDANLDALAAAREGTRNAMLWDVSRRLGQLSAGGALDSAEVHSALAAVVESWPNTSHSFDTIKRAFAAGTESPKSVPPSRLLTSVDRFAS